MIWDTKSVHHNELVRGNEWHNDDTDCASACHILFNVEFQRNFAYAIRTIGIVNHPIIDGTVQIHFNLSRNQIKCVSIKCGVDDSLAVICISSMCRTESDILIMRLGYKINRPTNFNDFIMVHLHEQKFIISFIISSSQLAPFIIT